MLAPINRIPPEILALIPDFWDAWGRDRNIIALTHVCRAWREVFISRSSLWSDFDYTNKEKTQVYFERSKSSPINLSLDLRNCVFPCDSFFQFIPRVTGRLKSLFVNGPLEDVEVVTSRLSHPAPLLERLSIFAQCYSGPYRYLPLTSGLFDGDLSSLRTLRLAQVCTGLPWRNMINLTSFTLSYTSSEMVTIGQLLDFFEGAPYLEEVKLSYAIPTTGAQNGRVVSLECLKSMHIQDDNRPSVLLSHLLIPVGARLEVQAKVFRYPIGEVLPRSLDNLKNFANFTAVKLNFNDMEFSGPNGRVKISNTLFGEDMTDLTLGLLTDLDTSKTERLEIGDCDLPSKEPLYQALLPMKDLRTLKLSGFVSLDIFIRALQPFTNSSEAMVCPKLEELVLTPCPFYRGRDPFRITSILEVAAARALEGGKLKTVKIFRRRGRTSLNMPELTELRKHVWNVEHDYMD